MDRFSSWVAGQGQVVLPLIGASITLLSWVLARTGSMRKLRRQDSGRYRPRLHRPGGARADLRVPEE